MCVCYLAYLNTRIHIVYRVNFPDSSVAMLYTAFEAFAINKDNSSKSDLHNVPRLRLTYVQSTLQSVVYIITHPCRI